MRYLGRESRFRRLIQVSALLTSLVFLAQLSSADEIENLLRLDGTEALLREIPVTLDQAARAQLLAEQADDYDPSRLLSLFSANSLRARIDQILGTSWRLESGAEIRGWFDSELGQQIRDSEKALSGPEAQRLMGTYVGTYAKLGAQEERSLLAERILESRYDVERLEIVARTAVQLSLRTLQINISPTDRLTGSEFDFEVERALEELRPELIERARWRVLFTHRSLTLSKVQEHVDFLGGSSAQWYFQAVNLALERSLNEALERHAAVR